MENITRSQLRHSSGLPNVFRNSRRTKPTVHPENIVGLTDGEGCFYVLVKPPYNKNGGAMVQLSFFIKVHEEDIEMLEKVKYTLGCGEVYFQHEKRANHSQCFRYTVNSHRDILNKVIPFFQKYPLQSNSKRRNFKLFRRIAALVTQGEHHDKKGIEKIRALKSKMNRRARVVREIRLLRGNSK